MKTTTSLVAVVAELERRARLDRDHAVRRELDPLGRLAEVHRQRALEHDEDLLLRLVRVAAPSAARRVAPERARDRPRFGRGRQVGSEASGIVLASLGRRAAPPSAGRARGRRGSPSCRSLHARLARCLSRSSSRGRPSARSCCCSSSRPCCRCGSTGTRAGTGAATRPPGGSLSFLFWPSILVYLVHFFLARRRF